MNTVRSKYGKHNQGVRTDSDALVPYYVRSNLSLDKGYPFRIRDFPFPIMKIGSRSVGFVCRSSWTAKAIAIWIALCPCKDPTSTMKRGPPVGMDVWERGLGEGRLGGTTCLKNCFLYNIWIRKYMH